MAQVADQNLGAFACNTCLKWKVIFKTYYEAMTRILQCELLQSVFCLAFLKQGWHAESNTRNTDLTNPDVQRAAAPEDVAATNGSEEEVGILLAQNCLSTVVTVAD